MHKWIDPKRISAILVFHIFYILMYVGAAFWPVSLDAKNKVLGVAYVFPPVIAVIGTTAAFIKKRAYEGFFWGSLALSMIALTAAELYWVYLQIFKGLSQPASSSFGTYAFLTGYAFMFLSLIRLLADFAQKEPTSVRCNRNNSLNDNDGGRGLVLPVPGNLFDLYPATDV